MKSYFTTFEAAKICQVSQGSMIRWIHDGKIPASVTPGGHHRIEANHLKQFLKQLRMPVPQFLGKEKELFLLITENSLLTPLIKRWVETAYPDSLLEEAREYFTAGWKASRFSPDLVILDLEMSTNSAGIKMCAQMRDLPEYKRTPFLILISSPSPVVQRKIISLGMSDWVPKPLDKNIFFNKMKTLLTKNLEFKKTGS